MLIHGQHLAIAMWLDKQEHQSIVSFFAGPAEAPLEQATQEDYIFYTPRRISWIETPEREHLF